MAPWVLDGSELSHACSNPRPNSFNLVAILQRCIEFGLLTDHTCILKTRVFTQRWYDKVVFIIKSPDWLIQTIGNIHNQPHNRLFSQSAVLTIGTIRKCEITQALIFIHKYNYY